MEKGCGAYYTASANFSKLCIFASFCIIFSVFLYIFVCYFFRLKVDSVLFCKLFPSLRLTLFSICMLCTWMLSTCGLSTCMLSTCMMSTCMLSTCMLNTCMLNTCMLNTCMIITYMMSTCTLSTCLLLNKLANRVFFLLDTRLEVERGQGQGHLPGAR